MKNVVLLAFLIFLVIVFAVMIRKNLTPSGNLQVEQPPGSNNTLATPSVFPSVKPESAAGVGQSKTIVPEY